MAQNFPHEESIFMVALQKTTAKEREAYVEGACGGNFELRQRVLELLKLHDESHGPIDAPPAIAPTIEMPGKSVAAEKSGTVIGPYKLLQQIGEGGMGAVYMAEQSAPVRRKVALKIIKPGMDTREVIARFEAERQALALMDHPNIARVFDAGATEAGRPYFVMELVRGVPFTDYCDQNDLPVHQRLELFVTVCHAVQHAHQKGIIHRDIKPSNVLVTLHDGRAVPKVIDFGVAKAIGQQLTDKTLFTQFAQMVGTPLYMSPEQAELTGLDVDTRADIYSLGVMLYELLTGTTPFESARMRKVALDEMRRIIREEDPPSPSARLSSTAGETQTAVAAHRHIDPKGLSRLVRGDLDWIVMKSLEKDRGRRYETANGLSRDLQRYLADEPVEACPPSTAYRLRKFVRRNKGKLLTAVLLAATLVTGTVVSTWQAIRAGKAEKLSRDRLVKEQEAHKEAEANLQRARELVDEYFTLVSDSKLLDVPALRPLRKELLEKALKYYEEFSERRTDDPSMLADLVTAELRITQIMYASGDRPDRFLPHMEKGNALAERLVWELHATPEIQRKLAGYLRSNPEVDIYEHGGTPIDPEIFLRILARNAALWEKFVLENPDVPGFQSDLAGTYLYMSIVQFKQNRRAMALMSIERSVALCEGLVRKYPTDPRYRLDLSRMYDTRGEGRSVMGLQDEARQNREQSLKLREQLVAEFPDVPVYRTWLARSYRDAGDHAARFDEAQQFYAKSLERFERLATEYPADRTCQRNVAFAAIHFGDACLKKGLPADAVRNFQKAVAAFETLLSLPPVHAKDRQSLVDAYRKSSQALSANHQAEEAEFVLRRAVAVIEEQASSDGDIEKWLSSLKPICAELIRLVTDSGTGDEAKEFAQRYSKQLQKSMEYSGGATPDRRLARAIDYNDLAIVLQVARFLPEAEEAFFTAKRLKQSLVTEFPENPAFRYHLAHSCLGLAHIAEESGRKTDAAQNLDEADSLLKAIAADTSTTADMRQWVAHTFWQLGDAYWLRLKRTDDAEKSFQRAAEMFKQLAADYPKAPFYRQEHAFGCWKIGWLRDYTNRTQEAEEPFRQGLAACKQLAADFPQELEYGLRLTRAHHELAHVLARKGQPAEAENERKDAIAEATRLIQLTPDRWEPWSTRASNYFLLRDWNAAIPDYSKSIELNPQVHWLWWNRGHAYLNSAQWEKAADNFKTVVERWPDGGEGWYLLAMALANLNQPEQSIANLRQGFAHGFRNVDWIKTDSRFAPLRTREDFEALLKELK